MARPPESLADLLDDPPAGGSSTAVQDPEVVLSWDELRLEADRLVGVLRAEHVAPGDRVGVMLDSSARAVVAVHAVLRAGAVVVPLDPRAPVGHVVGLARDCGVSVLVAEPAARRLDQLVVASPIRTVIGLEDAPGSITAISWDDVAQADPGARATVDGAAAAYLIYTSGSTGRPKGILHSHASGLAYARLASAAYDLGGSDLVATLSPLHFDQSTFSLYAAPMRGAGVLMVPSEVTRFPADLTRLLAERRATVWYSVPTLLLQALWRGVLDERDLTALRWVLFGGENLRASDLAGLMAALPCARFSNVYGPAEVNQCTFQHLDSPPRGDRPIPIGKPWDETEVDVVDAQGDPVATGSAGELLVRTSTAMLGYWNDLVGTDAAFRAGRDDVGSWYATGDLVRWDGDDLVFVGRIDNQVKVRGHRVELEAIDLALRALDGVRSATTVVRSGSAGLDDLVALVEAEPGFDPKVGRRHLARLVPSHAVPSEIVVVDALPSTSTGKVDRGASRELLDGSRGRLHGIGP